MSTRRLLQAAFLALVGFLLFVAFGRILWLLNYPSDGLFLLGVTLLVAWIVGVVWAVLRVYRALNKQGRQG